MPSRPKKDADSSVPPASGPIASPIEEGDRLRLLDHVEGGIAVCQADKFLYVNEPLLQLLKYPSLEALALNKVSTVSGSPSYDAWVESNAAGEPHAESWRTADGDVARVDVSMSTMKVGDVSVRVALVRDTTAAWRAQAQLQQTERLAAVGALAAGVAHQLNNPLAYVLANINFLAEEIPPFLQELGAVLDVSQNERLADLLSAMADAREGAERVARIVRDLRTFSRMEDERHELLDVQSLLDSGCVLIESELKNRGRLVKAYQPVSAVEANPSRLAQAFLNLLMNAAQAIPEGAPATNEVTVATHMDPHDGMVVIEVRDTGVGMAPAVQARIFDPFYTLKPVGEGTGLGLTTSMALIHNMGGSIAVESTEGSGSTFRVKIPPAVRSAKRDMASSPPDETTRQRMLVVDDELTLLASLRRALGRDIDVVLASSAKEAFAILERDDHFDVILCDIMMPEVTGIELYERMASLHPTLVDRFVFMTGGTFSAATMQFVESTERPHLDKPFDVRELRRLLRRMTKRTSGPR